MRSRRGQCALKAVLLLTAACGPAARVAPEASPKTSSGEPNAGAARPSEGPVPRSGSGSGASGSERTLEDARPADPSRALPRISTRHIGMHIGGESNSAESKRPFLRAIEAAEVEFLRCYRLVHAPLKGGTFGADLFVPAAGGQPEVRAVRQKLGGAEFERCMARALERVRFSARARPTVLSYSLRFELE